jgi:hypothetical protein
MTRNIELPKTNPSPAPNLAAVAGCIAATQLPSGEIPWCHGQKTDPWDLVEAVMGLSIGGFRQEAERAYTWLADHQNADGSWYSAYRNGAVADRTKDANFTAYIAVGLYHHYLITADRAFLARMWPVLQAAVEFALSLQAPHGEIFWAVNPAGEVDRMALLTGSSSVCLSLRCALAIAQLLGCHRKDWAEGLKRLEHAIAHKPHRFNMTKSRFAMDWYYPILCGAITGEPAHRRLERSWKKFVIEGQGVRCVSDRPWVTVAETCELALTLAAAGDRGLANIVFGWIADKHDKEGWYPAGFTFPDMTVWPTENLTWTNGAVLIAADAIFQLTPAGRMFTHEFWDGQYKATPAAAEDCRRNCDPRS